MKRKKSGVEGIGNGTEILISGMGDGISRDRDHGTKTMEKGSICTDGYGGG